MLITYFRFHIPVYLSNISQSLFSLNLRWHGLNSTSPRTVPVRLMSSRMLGACITPMSLLLTRPRPPSPPSHRCSLRTIFSTILPFNTPPHQLIPATPCLFVSLIPTSILPIPIQYTAPRSRTTGSESPLWGISALGLVVRALRHRGREDPLPLCKSSPNQASVVMKSRLPMALPKDFNRGKSQSFL